MPIYRPDCGQLYHPFHVLSPPGGWHIVYGQLELPDRDGGTLWPVVTYEGEVMAALDPGSVIETAWERDLAYVPPHGDLSWLLAHPLWFSGDDTQGSQGAA